MIEQYNPYIERLLHAEPWRAVGEGTSLCHGSLDWDGSDYWHCTGCGRIGSSPTPLHLPASKAWNKMGFGEYFRRVLNTVLPPRAPAA